MVHSFKKGDVVTVLNQTMGGRFIVEGDALIVGIIRDVDEQYRVRFMRGAKPTGDDYERFVDPTAQNDPAGFVETLNGNVEPPRNQTECDPLHGRRMDSADMGEC